MIEPTPRPKPPLPKRRSWERLEGETTTQHELFARYRDLKPGLRTVEAVSKQKGVKHAHQTLKDLCAEYHWVARANAYDDFVYTQAERIERWKRIGSLRKMRERHRDVGKIAMDKALRAIRKTSFVPKTPSEVATLIKAALALEESGHVFDPLEAIVSGDENEQPTEETEARRLAIEVFTTGGASLPADDLRTTLMGFYDQRPPNVPASVTTLPPEDTNPPPGLDEPDQGLDETRPPDED